MATPRSQAVCVLTLLVLKSNELEIITHNIYRAHALTLSHTAKQLKSIVYLARRFGYDCFSVARVRSCFHFQSLRDCSLVTSSILVYTLPPKHIALRTFFIIYLHCRLLQKFGKKGKRNKNKLRNSSKNVKYRENCVESESCNPWNCKPKCNQIL